MRGRSHRVISRSIRRAGALTGLAMVISFIACHRARSDDETVAERRPDLTRLRAIIDSVGRASRGTLGVGAELIETNERLVVGTYHHPMQSVYKLPIAMAVLDRVDRGTLRLDQDVTVPVSMFVTRGQYSPIRDKYPNGTQLSLREILRYNTSESDGTACDVLLQLIGGPREAMSYLEQIGVNELIVATTELEMGHDHRAQYRNWATPAGALALLRVVQEGRTLSDTSEAMLLRFLTETTTGPGRLRGDLPVGTVVAHKTGSSGTADGVAAATNDIGIITMPNGQHLAVAVFLTDSRAEDGARDRTIAAVARAAWETFVAATVQPTAGQRP